MSYDNHVCEWLIAGPPGIWNCPYRMAWIQNKIKWSMDEIAFRAITGRDYVAVHREPA